MTKDEIIEYLYENHVRADFKIEEMAEDLAEPVRMKGEWIRVSADKYRTSASYAYRCGRCGGITYDHGNFCPSCGADMRGESNDEC